MESGFPAITEPLLDRDHVFMTANREAPKPLCHASRLAMAPAWAVQDRAADAVGHFSGIDPCSVEANLQGSIKSLRELVDVQRVRADKAEARLSAIHALVTTPGIPALREQNPQHPAPRRAQMTQGRAFDDYRSGADGYFGVLVMPWNAIELQQRMRPDNGVVQRLTKRISDQSGTNPNSRYTCCDQKNTGKVHQ